MQFGQLHHIEYYVKDLKRSTEFWGWFLSEMGYSEGPKWEGGINYLHSSGTYIVFVQVAPEAMAIENNGYFCIPWESASRESSFRFAAEPAAGWIECRLCGLPAHCDVLLCSDLID
jgi:hypothetical protein